MYANVKEELQFYNALRQMIPAGYLCDYKKSLPFVQRTLNSNRSDRLKISAAQMLFGNMLNLDRGIFLPLEEMPVSIRPLSLYASEMLAMQKNLLEKFAAELLRTDL